MSIPAAALPAQAPSYIVRWSRYEGGEPMTFGPLWSRADADDFADMLRQDPDKTATVEETTPSPDATLEVGSHRSRAPWPLPSPGSWPGRNARGGR